MGDVSVSNAGSRAWDVLRPAEETHPDPTKWLEARALNIRPIAHIPQVLAILGPLLAGSANAIFMKAVGLW